VTHSRRNWNENTNLKDVTPTPTIIVKRAPNNVAGNDPPLTGKKIPYRFFADLHQKYALSSSSSSNYPEDEDGKILHAVTHSRRNWNGNTNLRDVTPTPTIIVKRAPNNVVYDNPDNDPFLTGKKDPKLYFVDLDTHLYSNLNRQRGLESQPPSPPRNSQLLPLLESVVRKSGRDVDCWLRGVVPSKVRRSLTRIVYLDGPDTIVG